MKSKISILILYMILIHAATFAQVSNSDDIQLSRFSVGLGISHGRTTDQGPGWGGCIDANYFLGNKFSIGVRSILLAGRSYSSVGDAKDSAGNVAGQEFYSYKGSSIMNFGVVSSYYVLGKNCDSKGGAFLSLGVGYFSYHDVFAIDITGTSTYGSGTVSTAHETKGLGLLFSAGLDHRLGIGRIFLDVPLEIGFAGKISEVDTMTGNVRNIGIGNSSSERSIGIADFIFFNETVVTSFNLGYKIYFQ
ncbi:MAG: hypothetical protein HY064_12960 [Bacteroidetes bacterium]|nr:hypothetical protein [Bacteroidota bacterium]